MKNLLVLVVLVAIVVLGVGLWRGWFDFGGKKEGDQVKANLNVNLTKFKQDKEEFQKILNEKSGGMKKKLAKLKDKAKDLTGDAKVKTEKEIEGLSKKHLDLQSKMKDLEEATEEKLQGLKSSIMKEFEDEPKGGKEDESKKPE
ncbi:MAG TPA: hypothetical protein VK395_04245 [Gemmataceae bacterium]|nr:hypothetical protein [Gemmataceae bacterium]